MIPSVVWFNQHFSNTWRILRMIREVRRPGELRLFCSHTRKDYPGATECDHFELEPRGVGNADYVAFCLEFVRRHSVRAFYQWRRIVPLMKALHQFADLGTCLITPADVPVFERLHSKIGQHHAVADGVVALPEYEIVNTVAEFDAAYARLRGRVKRICFKPAISMFGWGFRILSSRDTHLDNEKLPRKPASLDEARRQLAAKEPFSDLMLMRYLPGPERSVDCLANHGRLLRCVIRRKSMEDASQQIIENNKEIEEIARRLTALFGFNAVFNIQLRDDESVPYLLDLLEVNPRMAGGLPFACESGVCLPYWAVRSALGTANPEDNPYPETGISICTSEANGSI